MRTRADGEENPLANSPDSIFEVLGHSAGSPDHPSPTVHLLDRDSDMLLFLFEYLSAGGYSVSASCSATDAFELLGRSHPDLFFADIEASEMTEWELLYRVKGLSPATRVVLTSGVSRGARGEYGRAGAPFVPKPIDWSALGQILELEQRR